MSKLKKIPLPETFQEAFTELETITASFERSDLDLDEGMNKFERGLALAAACREKLGQVEVKIKEIEEKYAAPASGDGLS